MNNTNWTKLTTAVALDIAKTFECGQCFRWNLDDHGIYTGIAYGRVAKLRQDGSDVYILAPPADIKAIWDNYFDIERDYEQIRRNLRISDFMSKAADFGKGIRILQQEPWETLCSFIISQNNHIPRIKAIIDKLCTIFGEPIEFQGQTLYTFPSAERLSQCSETDLEPLRCGYRSGYIIDAARLVADGTIDLKALLALPIDEARNALKQIRGVGDKVADCVLLFGLHKLDTFPVDVWIKRALTEHCEPGFDPSALSPYAGLAQQYMFYYLRNGLQ